MLYIIVSIVISGVIAYLGDAAVFPTHGDEPSLIGANPHGAEFVEAEGHAVLAYPFLRIEARTAAGQAYAEVDNKENWREEHQSDSGEEDVEESNHRDVRAAMVSCARTTVSMTKATCSSVSCG